MKTTQYVRKYNLNNPDLNELEVDLQGILEDLGEEFHEKLSLNLAACKKMHVEFNYGKFLHLIKDMKQKIDSISNKKWGSPFPESFFSTFFAIHVIPARAELYPEEHKVAQAKRATYNAKPKEKSE